MATNLLKTALRRYKASSLALFILCAPSAHGNTNGLITIQWEKTTYRASGAKGFVELANGDLLATRTFGREALTKIICSRSADGGMTWRDLSVIAQEDIPGLDMGDGHLMACHDGTLLCSFRKNLCRGPNSKNPHYQIKVKMSRDNGLSWTDHSTVKTVQAASGEVRGLWSSFLHQRKDGTILCFYDDEDEAWRAGFKRHQWLMLKMWDDKTTTWSAPVIVSRAKEPQHLSRDGMPSVLEQPDGSLLCALESVIEEPPCWNVIRLVRSVDRGKTWDWQTQGRQILYCPEKKRHSAVSPWLSQLTNGSLVCVFATDEDRDTPDEPGAPIRAMNRDINFVSSSDHGKTWATHASPVALETHKTYMPQMVQLRHPRHKGVYLCLYLDTTLGFRCLRGN
jgi:hypothetical protein